MPLVSAKDRKNRLRGSGYGGGGVRAEGEGLPTPHSPSHDQTRLGEHLELRCNWTKSIIHHEVNAICITNKLLDGKELQKTKTGKGRPEDNCKGIKIWHLSCIKWRDSKK